MPNLVGGFLNSRFPGLALKVHGENERIIKIEASFNDVWDGWMTCR